MPTIFKYNNKLIQCMNLDKKLKKIRANKEDIEIIWEGECTQDKLEKKFVSLTSKQKEDTEVQESSKLYCWENIITHYKIFSIDNDFDSIVKCYNIENVGDWIKKA